MSRKVFLPLFALLLLFSNSSQAQSIISGTITGTVTDPTNAAVPSAMVTATNAATNTTQRTNSGSDGTYRFPFLPPGNYTVSASAQNFQTQERRNIVVNAGEPTPVNIQMALATETSTVNVVETTNALQTDNADVSTNFNREMVENLPNPGGDITYVAQTAPGVVMNTQGGYGNFVADGMPSNSNLFSVNGQNYNDPFFGINNSGASNLLLGFNDIGEANVINRPYSAQYGQYAGAQVTYITKSGTNQFHGSEIYNWNGRALNANQFFNNATGLGTPFNNFNQWAANVSGPIVKNRTFFDVDYEGLRTVLPTASNLTLIPSPQFQTATLANLSATGNAAEIPFYNQLFAVYNNAPGHSAAVPANNGGCSGFTGLPAAVPCALQFRTTPPNRNREYQWSARVDHTFGSRDSGFIRVLRDNGFQPTFTSPFGPTFNAESTQPQMSGQVTEIHTFSPRTVNQLNGSVLFYSASFGLTNPAAALAALPTFINFSGETFTSAGAFGQPGPFFYPQGRRVFQYQVIDDLSHTVGNHNLRIGFSWLHDNITDLDFQSLAGPIHGSLTTTIADFFAGGGPGTNLQQSFPLSPQQYLKFNTLGGYIADDWKVTPRFTVSLNLRLENYANPTCDNNCFSRLSTSFSGTPVPNATSVPYNQFIIFNQKNAFPNTQTLVWEPRLGIAWRPSNSDRTVIRAGAGIFADELPGGLAENAGFNPPALNSFNIGNGAIAPGVPGSLFTTTAQANQALLNQFRSGGSFSSISAAVPGFSPPTFYGFPNKFLQPTYYKWNFEVQQQLSHNMVLNLNYSGNHGIHLPLADEGLNGYCPPATCPGGFAGLPAAPANPALGTVIQYLGGGISNYNGFTVSLQRRLAQGILFTLNYTWSHALDELSNGGIANEPFSIGGTVRSVSWLENPFNARANYGDADYDVRNYFSANLVMTDLFRKAGFHHGSNRIFGGWTLSSNWFYRSGLPFTAIDTAASNPLRKYNYRAYIFAQPATALSPDCTRAVDVACLSTSEFAPSGGLTGFGFGGRNNLSGPHFFDVDLGLMKDIQIKERLVFSFGAQAFNVFNHTNFDLPVNDIADPNFGYSIATVGPPTSLLGSFVGAGSSPRFVEIRGQLRF
jgi:hypothetical protein